MSRPLRFNARQVHLCCALWAIRALMGVLSSVYSVNIIFNSPVCRRGYGTLSHRRLTGSLSVMYLNTFVPSGTEQNGSLSKPGHMKIRTWPSTEAAIRSRGPCAAQFSKSLG